MLTRATFRLELAPNEVALRDHPVWASYTEPNDGAVIASWGVDPSWLEQSLRSFDGFDQGYTHPMFPVLDYAAACELSHLCVAADFTLANGAALLGFLVETHAFGLFIDGGIEMFNPYLRAWAREAAGRVEQRLGSPAFPARWTARASCAEAGLSGTVEPWR